MSFSILTVFALLLSGVVASETPPAGDEGAAPPEHQVVAIYFHRTERCPTCKRIGSLAEEAVTEGFAKELEAGTVEFRFVDFQDKDNADLAKQYNIKSPTLVLQNNFDGETICWTALPKVWQLHPKPDEFHAYVQQGITDYLKQSQEEAQQQADKAKEAAK